MCTLGVSNRPNVLTKKTKQKIGEQQGEIDCYV